MPGTVALTGATGFIGSALARHLVESGYRVRALVRPGSSTRRLRGLDIQRIPGTLDDPAAMDDLMHDAEAFVYCAGAVRGARRSDFEPANVDGVRRVLRSISHGKRPPRLVLISSLAARCPHLSDYAWSKRQGERIVQSAPPNVEWVVIRPPVVYGPEDRELLPLLQWMNRGFAPLVGDSGARVSLIYVSDLVEAIVRTLRAPGAVRRVIEVDDGRPGGYSWGDVASAIERLRGRRVLRVPVPPAVLRAAAVLSEFGSRLRGSAPMLTQGKVREICHPDWVCESARVMELIGWTPRVGLSEGLSLSLSVTPRSPSRGGLS